MLLARDGARREAFAPTRGREAHPFWGSRSGPQCGRSVFFMHGARRYTKRK